MKNKEQHIISISGLGNRLENGMSVQIRPLSASIISNIITTTTIITPLGL